MRILAVYTVTHGAMVELHSARASADINSANHCIWNAGKIIEWTRNRSEEAFNKIKTRIGGV